MEQDFRIPDDDLGSRGIANRGVPRRAFFRHRQSFSVLKPRRAGGAVDPVGAGGTVGDGGTRFSGHRWSCEHFRLGLST